MTKRVIGLEIKAHQSISSKSINREGFFMSAVKNIRNKKGKAPPKLTYLWVTFLVAIWYAFAILGTIASKSFIKKLHKPFLLAGGQMFIGAALDLFILAGFGLTHLIDRTVIKAALPIGITLTIGRWCTYVSYETVAASLTQTVKASSPVFTVILLFIMEGKCQPTMTLLSLIPIIFGVVLSAVTEMEIKLDGFLFAICAGVVSTVQAYIAKRCLKRHDFHPLVFHMCSNLWAALFLLPGSFITEGRPWGLIESLQMFRSDNSMSMLRILFASFFCYWGQNLTSILVLSQIHVLSHQVANVSRRFAIIICSMVYFGNKITVTKLVGIVLALAGFGWFSRSKKLILHPAMKSSTPSKLDKRSIEMTPIPNV
mmetsp:Transcript_17312/g.25959  ORF Transcript_17312/g.25959 Transcript_17312/m.25959 type:complete len:370 (+) Transcript_17312:68-1177(+)